MSMVRGLDEISFHPDEDLMLTQAYLDWNATGPLRPEAQAAVIVAMAVAGNPSSVHADGRAAPRGGRAGAGRGAGRRHLAGRRVHFGWHRGQHAGAVACARRDAAGVSD